MLSKFGITNIIECLGNPINFFKTLNNIEFDTSKGAYFYINKQAYNFIVLIQDAKYQLKFYKDYSSDKSQTDYITIKLASEMKDSPFSKALWLSDEFCFSFNKKTEMYDVAMYEMPSKESFEYFLHSFNTYEDKNSITKRFNSFLESLKWLLNSNYTTEKLSLAAFCIYENNEVLINTLDINIKSLKSAQDTTCLVNQVASVLSSALQTISSCDNIISPKLSTILNSVNTENKSELISLIDEILELDIVNYSSSIESVNCFNNPNYKIEEFREENRIVVTDTKTNLKGYSTYDGVLVTNCIYDDLTNYNEGIAVAMLDGMTGVIDKDNRIILNFEWDWIEVECDYNLFVAIKDGYSIILNRKAERISDKKFKFVSTFFDGYSIVTNENNKTGVINQNCEYVIKPIYDTIDYCQMREFKVTLGMMNEKIEL